MREGDEAEPPGAADGVRPAPVRPRHRRRGEPAELATPRPETGAQEIELRELWRRYRSSGDERAREQLVIAYSPLVKYVAGRMGYGLPAHIEQADLISSGLLGLLDAISRFEPERKVAFEGYAMTRIRGAIIDELRSLDWVPRSVRARAREIERAGAKLGPRLRRAPSDEEMAIELEMTVQEFQSALLEIANSTVSSLDDLWTIGNDDGEPAQSTPAGGALDDPRARAGDRELKERMADAVGDLPDREKRLIALYYVEGLTLREVGEVLGVTESRVSQLHARAVLAMRASLAADA